MENFIKWHPLCYCWFITPFFFLQKYAWMDDSGTRSEKSFEEEEMRKNIEDLATQIELR